MCDNQMLPWLALNEEGGTGAGLALGIWGSIKGTCGWTQDCCPGDQSSRLKPDNVCLLLFLWLHHVLLPEFIPLMGLCWGFSLLRADTKGTRCIISWIHEDIWNDRYFESHFKDEETMAEVS